MLHIPVILGSTRPGRTSEKVLPWVMAALKKEKNITAEALDLRDYPLPFYDEPTSPAQVKDGQYPNDSARKWAEKIRAADAFIVIAPEYNHGPSAVLKNAFDSIYAEWNNKPIAFVAYGSAGGARSVEQLREIAVELQMAPIRSGVHIQSPWALLGEDGNFKKGALEAYDGALASLIGQLRWWGDALKAARGR